jgi:hypothetical protein
MTPFRKTLVLAATTAVAALATGAGVASAHTTRFDSDVSIQVGVSFPTNSYVFNGDVTSPRGGCVADRRVTLFRDEPSGADVAMGSDRSDENGSWSVSKPISEVPGNTRYYAQVKKRDIGRPGHDHICRGARSGTIEIE